MKEIVTKCTFAFKELSLQVVLIYIDAIIKLLNNEFMFHLVNNHVVPLGITCNIMNISNNCLETLKWIYLQYR